MVLSSASNLTYIGFMVNRNNNFLCISNNIKMVEGDRMIVLYSGTPGSGKSLHASRDILTRIKFHKMTIGNFPIAKETEYYVFNDKDLNVEWLINFSREYFKTHPYHEGEIRVYIDEAQLLFNCRDFTRKDRELWISFFTQHRHLGYDIYFMCQFDRMLDRQIRSLIEYEYIHKKVNNFGFKGWIISLLFLAPSRLFVCTQMWKPLNERIGAEYFRFSKKLGKLYDTNRLFDNLREDFKNNS